MSSTVGIGDVVYVSGILNESHKYLNNKFGVIKKITAEINDVFAEVLIGNEIIPLSFNVLFKIDEFDMDPILIKHIFNPIQYYFRTYLVNQQMLVINDDATSYCYCKTNYGTDEMITLSTLN